MLPCHAPISHPGEAHRTLTIPSIGSSEFKPSMLEKSESGLIDAIRPTKQVIEDMMAEARELLGIGAVALNTRDKVELWYLERIPALPPMPTRPPLEGSGPRR